MLDYHYKISGTFTKILTCLALVCTRRLFRQNGEKRRSIDRTVIFHITKLNFEESVTLISFFRQSIKAQLQKTKDEMPQGLMREVMETYKPHILSRRRRLIEDCVRDLRLNNDHIHIIEQEMRLSLQVRRN